MMTVITIIDLPDGVGPQWDEAMRDRLVAAEEHEGWIAGQLLIPADSLNGRVIVGVWETRSHWQAWHTDPMFESTRERLDDLAAGSGTTTWHETIYHSAS